MKRASVLKPAGTIIFTDLDGKEFQRDTIQCGHCQRHWEVKPGSGKLRGFCTNCNKPTCGTESCLPCVAFEKWLDIVEGTRNPTSTSVPVPKLWLPGE